MKSYYTFVSLLYLIKKIISALSIYHLFFLFPLIFIRIFLSLLIFSFLLSVLSLLSVLNSSLWVFCWSTVWWVFYWSTVWWWFGGLALPAWWWLGFPLIFGLGLGFVSWVFWVLPLGIGFCRLGFLGFAAWVSVHGMVVVDGLGLGLGSRRGGGWRRGSWKRVWVFGGGAVGLGLEVVEPCRIWVFFFSF